MIRWRGRTRWNRKNVARSDAPESDGIERGRMSKLTADKARLPRCFVLCKVYEGKSSSVYGRPMRGGVLCCLLLAAGSLAPKGGLPVENWSCIIYGAI